MLLIDVGNTKTALAWADQGKILYSWKIATHAHRLKDEYIVFINQVFKEKNLPSINDETPVVLCSVVPKVSSELTKLSKRVFVLHSAIEVSFKIKVESPHTIGADRLADLEAALQHYETPLIVIDFGTATTLSVVNEKKEFIGGLICPGFGISAEALFEKAAALSSIHYNKSDSIVGFNTQTALSNGVCMGHASMVEALVQKICAEKQWTKTQVIATGGALDSIGQYLPNNFIAHEHLALHGLLKLGEKQFFKKNKA
ncbi:MAG TPA: type III pantothenate kinase [Oligoflexia bacterium]|nr:type III pantothenate kinase [Oligoflexia bacterium]HMR25157.1 type III pantothenate kinase [Oligoflexia bacterium]